MHYVFSGAEHREAIARKAQEKGKEELRLYVTEMTDFDDFTITNDNLRLIDYIHRAMEVSDMPLPGPVLDQAQAIQEPADIDIPVNLNAEPQWSKQDFAFLKKTLSNYWCQKKRFFKTEFALVMPSDRFLSIWQFLHVAENRQPDVARPDRLAKLRPMLDHLNSKFKSVYVPNGHVTID
ncbi:PiggyBac-like protein Tpb2p [Elysia marginata]|uniref:PiggyBac-like protein Tpb2p n=1 Tax=Elysia marginata TaxID=1093978 RepID=A0AAV4EFM2_9GAST|nr:PiggyBac-like protein Tpb2p [Elysia marginata]